jgi:hypothetical protein
MVPCTVKRRAPKGIRVGGPTEALTVEVELLDGLGVVCRLSVRKSLGGAFSVEVEEIAERTTVVVVVGEDC